MIMASAALVLALALAPAPGQEEKPDKKAGIFRKVPDPGKSFTFSWELKIDRKGKKGKFPQSRKESRKISGRLVAQPPDGNEVWLKVVITKATWSYSEEGIQVKMAMDSNGRIKESGKANASGFRTLEYAKKALAARKMSMSIHLKKTNFFTLVGKRSFRRPENVPGKGVWSWNMHGTANLFDWL